MVYPENCTPVTEIQLTAFKAFEGIKILMFVLLLIIYIFICIENVLIIYIIFSSSRLKALMFLIVQSMCVGDLIGISNIIPKLLSDILCDRATITIVGCLVQLQVYGIDGSISALHYALMSYDRYLAVCHPLRYSSFVNTKIYFRTILTFWIIVVAIQCIHCWFQSQIQFCGHHNTINQFFCDFFPFLDLATSDTTVLRIFTYVMSSSMVLVTFLSVIIPYMFIIHTILKIPSANGRRKTFSTSSSHLIVFSSQYFLSISIYVFPAHMVTIHVLIAFTFTNFFWTRLMNPLLYTFSSKLFRTECMIKIRNVL